jgi:flagellum-specific peptidoglycan hydrolase FlgJ
MLSASKPSWQQVTALVSLSASGTVTGFSFVPHSPADLMSPTSMPVRLMALERSVQPAATGDAALRSAIVNVASYYLRMAQGKTPAEMEAIIWQHDSVDGVDHGESCAAFASLTLELAAQVVGQQSWVTGGTSYPWPLNKWADVRVDPNPSSPNIVSVLQDAEAHGRWYPLGDGYQPQPGDWVLFDGHVEVVTKYADGTLYTIGGDSLPNFSVNAHEYPGPLAAQGVVGFVNNGGLPAAAAPTAGGGGTASGNGATLPGSGGTGSSGADSAAVPGASGTGSAAANSGAMPGTDATRTATAAVPGTSGTASASTDSAAVPAPGRAAVPGAGSAAVPGAASAAVPAAASAAVPGAASAAVPAAASAAVPAAASAAVPGAAGAATHGGRAPRAEHRASGSGTAARASRALPTIPGAPAAGGPAARTADASDDAAIPGTPAPVRNQAPPVRHGPTVARRVHADHGSRPTARAVADADVPGTDGLLGPAVTAQTTTAGAAAIPGAAQHQSGAATPYQRHQPQHATAPVQDSSAQQAFIDEIAPGAMATQRKYGVPAAVTIAQAIDESGWGQSLLASQAHNLFGIKGDGPAGADWQPTQEYENGQWVTINAAFRVYDNVTESIDDHGELLATSGYYTQAMADRNDPDAFANALTGVYATNPDYGSDLIQLMQQYDLYRYDAPAAGARAGAPAPEAHASAPAPAAHASAPAEAGYPSAPAEAGTMPDEPAPQPSVPGLTPTASGSPAPTPTPPASPSPGPTPSASSRPAPWPTPTPTPSGTAHPSPNPTPPPSAPARPGPSSTPTQTPSAPAHSAPSATRTPAPTLSAPAQPAPSRARTPARSASPATSASVRPEPRASRTYESDWVAGSGILMASGLGDLARRRKRAPRGEAADPHDRPVSTTISSTLTEFVDRPPARGRPWPAPANPDRPPVHRYQQRLPTAVKNDFVSTARGPLLHGELLYRDVASSVGLSWELLAACDWMQCQARPRYSPVHGEKLGARNHDGSVYWSRSEALEQCARDLVSLAGAVYGIDLTTELELSVADLARVFAAFRWGGLLKRHRTSAMEFPYSVAGLTVQHMNMRWPNIGEPNTPDKPGARFRKPFGAVPIVLSLHYPATVQ